MVNTVAKTGWTLPASRVRLPDRTTAITPRMGSPTALTASPAMAGQVSTPACAPS